MWWSYGWLGICSSSGVSSNEVDAGVAVDVMGIAIAVGCRTMAGVGAAAVVVGIVDRCSGRSTVSY